MEIRILAAFLLGMLCCTPATAGGSEPVADVSIHDTHGIVRHLSHWHEHKLLVVAFVGVDCPVAKLYAPTLDQLATTFGARGVAFIGVDPHPQETPSQLQRFGRDHSLSVSLFHDPDQTLTQALGVTRTPEVVILDQNRVVRYRGRIDDQYSPTAHRGAETRRDLALALEDALADRPVAVPETEATGCIIDRKTPATTAGYITYNRHVAPILQKHCQSCHRPDQIAPFSLTNYTEAVRWAAMIREVVNDGRMPPWGARPNHGHFANDPRLSDSDKAILFAWDAGGRPEGKPSDLPPSPKFPNGWVVGTPDVVFSMPRPFAVPAQGAVEYQYFLIDPGFTEDKWVKSAEIRPGNRAVVHHCGIYLVRPGEEAIAEEGWLGSQCLDVMAPGTPPMNLPNGMAKRIPAGWKLLLIVHYAPIGQAQLDQTSIGITFVEPKDVRREVATRVIMDNSLKIPPGASDYRIEAEHTMPAGVLLLSLFPHAHYRGKSFRYDAVYPDGRTDTLLDVPDYDYNWQFRYQLAEPKYLPKDTVLRLTATYDNSSNNLANPDPNVTVYAGPQSIDEMFTGYYTMVLADDQPATPMTWREFFARWFKPQNMSTITVLTWMLFVFRRARIIR